MSENPQPADKPKLRWYQYRLWHIFALMTLVAIGCSWFACKMAAANKRKEAVEVIADLGGFVFYDYQLDANGDWNPNLELPGPAWFRNLVGVDFLADVVYVNFYAPFGRERSYPRVTDDWIQEHITPLANLEYIDLSGSQVTADGVRKLQKALPNCKIHPPLFFLHSLKQEKDR